MMDADRYLLPGEGDGWVKLRGEQGWRDQTGLIWKKDRLHGDHWDVTDRHGVKVLEVDFLGRRIWPFGPKHRGSKP
jgi:hypothetical protein